MPRGPFLGHSPPRYSPLLFRARGSTFPGGVPGWRSGGSRNQLCTSARSRNQLHDLARFHTAGSCQIVQLIVGCRQRRPGLVRLRIPCSRMSPTVHRNRNRLRMRDSGRDRLRDLAETPPSIAISTAAPAANRDVKIVDRTRSGTRLHSGEYVQSNHHPRCRRRKVRCRRRPRSTRECRPEVPGCARKSPDCENVRAVSVRKHRRYESTVHGFLAAAPRPTRRPHRSCGTGGASWVGEGEEEFLRTRRRGPRRGRCRAPRRCAAVTSSG